MMRRGRAWLFPLALELKSQLIGKAPEPILIGLKRLHDRVGRLVVMLGRVLVLRRITTANMTARAADPQMHPRITHFQTFLASVSRRCDIANLIEVAA